MDNKLTLKKLDKAMGILSEIPERPVKNEIEVYQNVVVINGMLVMNKKLFVKTYPNIAKEISICTT